MICLSLLPAVGMTAQNVDDNHLETSKDNKHFFNHLDISLTTGSTGIGLDVAMPVAEWMKLRAGFTYMPRFNQTMHFGVQIGDKPETEEEQQSKFDRLNGMLESFVGTKVDRQIDMIGEPCFDNVKLLADFYPFKNKKWHITAGFYYGGSKIAKAWNATEDATSLVAVAMYNNLYGRVVKSYESVLASMSDPNAVHEANLLMLDISKAKFKLGWEPRMNIDQCAALVSDWYKRYKTENVYSLCVDEINKFIR